MEALFILLVVPAVLAGLVYVGYGTYQRYKENQLANADDSTGEVGDEWKELSSDLLSEVEKAAEKIVDEAEKKGLLDNKCGVAPKNSLYLPCSRLKDHKGPCAHAIKPDHKGNVVISFADAKYMFDVFNKEELDSRPMPTSCHDERNEREKIDAEAHNAAYARLEKWLLGKETRFAAGNQVCDPLAMIGKMVIPEPKANKPVVEKPREQVAILPNELIVFMGNHNLTIEQIIRLSKDAMRFEEANNAPMAERIRVNALKKERETHLAQLKEIQAKVEDEQFLAKTTIEAREAEIATLKTELSKLKEEAVAVPSVIGPRPRIPKLVVTAKRKPAVIKHKRKKNGSV